MTRHEFDQAFSPMVKALGVKINSTQADYFWMEFGKYDPRDFGHACRELAMGNPGYLPKLEIFRDYVVSAKEMRVEGESVAKNKAAERLYRLGPKETGNSLDDQFAKCCHAIITKDSRLAVAFVEKQLEDQAFMDYLESWSTKSGFLAKDWLMGQVEAIRDKTGVRNLVGVQ